MSPPRTKSPFPGMDPYLEQYWGDVHHALCTYARDLMRRSLPAGLIARMDERTIIEMDSERSRRTVIPGVRIVERGVRGIAVMEAPVAVSEPLVFRMANDEVTEGFVEIIDTHSGGKVVTVLEFASPANKTSKHGREMYLAKQDDLLAGGVSLVEIDLIRSGPWIVRLPDALIPADQRGLYTVCVSRGWKKFQCEVYPIRLGDSLPAIRVPLRETDPDAVLDLQALFDQVYENGSYGYDVDYSKPPRPPLSDEDAALAKTLLASALK